MVRIDKPMSARTKNDVSYKFSKVGFVVIFHSEFSHPYGVATCSRLLKIKGLFYIQLCAHPSHVYTNLHLF